jgi:hypothetical protein
MVPRRYVPTIAALSVLVCSVIVAWFLIPRLIHEEPRIGSAFEFPNLNCRFRWPDAPWRAAGGSIQKALKAAITLQRDHPRTWMALAVVDYRDRNPAESEARDEIIARLRAYFNEGLEWDDAADTQLAGRQARLIQFRGETGGERMSGECAMLTHRGLVYWLVVWAPVTNAEASAGEYDDLRGRLELLDRRNDWKPASGPERTYRLGQGAGTLAVRDALWEAWEPATDYDPSAVLALVGRERQKSSPRESRGRPMVAASAIVLVLKPAGSDSTAAGKRAIDYLEKTQKTLYPETKIDKLSDLKAVAAEEKAASPAVRLVPLKVRNGEHRHRYFLLGTMPGKDGIVVVQCECAWEKRQDWEAAFAGLIQGLRGQ